MAMEGTSSDRPDGGGEDWTAADVVVVGAGVSGLTAAYHLTTRDPNLRVVVVEAKERVGGRTLLQELKAASGTDVWDFGGQWVGSCQPHVMALIEELGLEVYRQYTEGRKVMQLGDNRIRTYKSSIPSLSLLSLLDLHQFMSKIESWQKTVPVEDPKQCVQAQLLDSMTVDEAVRTHVWTKAVRESLEAASRTIWGAELPQMSMLYILAYCNAAGGLRPIIESDEGSGQEFKIKGGAGQIASLLAERVGQQNIWLSQPVSSISQDDDGVKVALVTGKVIHSKYCIMATPPHQTVKIHFEPAFPTEKLHVLQNMPVGYITKFIITYQTAFWREKGLSGEVVTNGGPSVVPGMETGPLCVVFDATSCHGNPAIVGFIGGKQQRQYNKLTPTERKAAVLESLASYLGPETVDYLEYREKDWSQEPYSGGGPVCVGTPGMMTSLNEGLRHPHHRIHFAGTESATIWCGFINGAIQAGYRAANEVLYHLRPQTVTPQDMKGTVYDTETIRRPLRPPRGSGRRHVAMTLVVGSLCLVGLLYHKGYIKTFRFKH